MKYGRKLVQVLAFSGWTQDRLADLLGVSTNALNSWVNGRSEPHEAHAVVIDELYAGLVEPYVCELEQKADALAAKLLRRQIRDLGNDDVCK